MKPCYLFRYHFTEKIDQKFRKMETFEQAKMPFPLPYPYKESKNPVKSRINIIDIPQFIHSQNMKEEVYPDVKSSQAIYIAGTPDNEWVDFYCDIYIYCCEFRIGNLFIIWNCDCYIRVIISDPNWKQYIGEVPSNFINTLINDYNIGRCLPLIEGSPRKTLLSFPMPSVYQMYISPAVGKTSENEAKHIPPINFNNISAYDVVRDLGQTVFAHASCAINLARFNEDKYIKDILIYATAHGFKGVVFHCGSSVNDPIPDCIAMMIKNIVTGIRAAIFSPNQIGTAKFLLETPAGKGNEMLTTFGDFNLFCHHIKTQYPDVAPFFGICVDTCHIFDCSYVPNKYINELLKYHTIDLIHFNDSCNPWGSRKDRHARPGEGYIPWFYLLRVAQIAKKHGIPTLFEN